MDKVEMLTKSSSTGSESHRLQACRGHLPFQTPARAGVGCWCDDIKGADNVLVQPYSNFGTPHPSNPTFEGSSCSILSIWRKENQQKFWVAFHLSWHLYLQFNLPLHWSLLEACPSVEGSAQTEQRWSDIYVSSVIAQHYPFQITFKQQKRGLPSLFAQNSFHPFPMLWCATKCILPQSASHFEPQYASNFDSLLFWVVSQFCVSSPHGIRCFIFTGQIENVMFTFNLTDFWHT